MGMTDGWRVPADGTERETCTGSCRRRFLHEFTCCESGFFAVTYVSCVHRGRDGRSDVGDGHYSVHEHVYKLLEAHWEYTGSGVRGWVRRGTLPKIADKVRTQPAVCNRHSAAQVFVDGLHSQQHLG